MTRDYAPQAATIRRYNDAVREGRAEPPDPNNVALSRKIAGITRAQPATQELAAEILAILNGDGLGHIKDADHTAAGLLALTLRRVYQCEAILDERGLVGRRGEVRPIAGLLVQLLKQAREFCDSLAMTPLSRAKLGLGSGKAAGEVLALMRALQELDKTDPQPSGEA